MSIQTEAENLTKSMDAIKKATSALDIYIGRENGMIKFHLGNLESLEQVPGTIQFYNRESKEYPFGAAKKCGGVLFFTILSQKDFDEIGPKKEEVSDEFIA